MQNTNTKVYFSNSNANERTYKDRMGLSDQEYSFIKNEPSGNRKLLHKTEDGSVVAMFDLSGMDDYLSIFSGNRARSLFALEKHAESPESWMDAYLLEVKR